MKLGLGTVQFGCNYGISNKNGQVNRETVKEILAYAKENGINTLDTASLYGNSESVLGSFDLTGFNVITKTTKIDKNLSKEENLKVLKNGLENSKANLADNKLYGIMFHEANDLLSGMGEDLWNLLVEFKNKGFVQKIGVSVYTPDQLLKIIKEYKIQIVQLPLNLLDQRFATVLGILKDKNIEIHTRSTFLQGLLLMNSDEIDDYFNDIKFLLNDIPEPKLSYTLDFVKNLKQIDKIIVGCTTKNELQEIIMMYNKEVKRIDYSRFKINDEQFILPQNWKRKG